MITILWKILRCFLWTIIVLFSLIVVIILAIVCIELYTHIERKNTYNSHVEIEKLIGYDIPPFDVLDYEEENVNTHLVQGYTMKKTISFKELPDSIYYNYLDSLCKIENSGWNLSYVEYQEKMDSLNDVYKGNWYSRPNLDSIARIELSNWEELTDCFLYYGNSLRIRIDKDRQQAIIKYNILEINQ